MGWWERGRGLECWDCGRRTGLLSIRTRHPTHPARRAEYPEGVYGGRAKCLDVAACDARVAKAEERARTRSTQIILATRPGDADACAFVGNCSWCGETMYRPDKPGVVDGRRSYHRAEHGERDCRKEKNDSYAYEPREALLIVARLAGESELRCVDCDALCARIGNGARDGRDLVPWEADHDVPLEDGGEHAIENLRCRCAGCHRTKTGRENAARARARRPPSLQESLL